MFLDKVDNWSDANGFKFSKTKTAYIHFCNNRKLHPDQHYQYAILLFHKLSFLMLYLTINLMLKLILIMSIENVKLCISVWHVSMESDGLINLIL